MENRDSILYYIADKIGELCQRFHSLENRLCEIEYDMRPMNQRYNTYRSSFNNPTIHNPHQHHLIIPPPPRYVHRAQPNHVTTPSTQTETELRPTLTHHTQTTLSTPMEEDDEWTTDDEAMEQPRSQVKRPITIPPKRTRNTQQPTQRAPPPVCKTTPTSLSDIGIRTNVQTNHGYGPPPPVVYIDDKEQYTHSERPPNLSLYDHWEWYKKRYNIK